MIQDTWSSQGEPHFVSKEAHQQVVPLLLPVGTDKLTHPHAGDYVSVAVGVSKSTVQVQKTTCYQRVALHVTRQESDGSWALPKAATKGLLQPSTGREAGSNLPVLGPQILHAVVT